MKRRPAHLATDDLHVEHLPDGRVLVHLPVAQLPFGAILEATAVYPDLRAFLRSVPPHLRESPCGPLRVRKNVPS